MLRLVTAILLVLSGSAAILRAPAGFDPHAEAYRERFVLLQQDGNIKPTGMTLGLWNNAQNTTLTQARVPSLFTGTWNPAPGETVAPQHTPGQGAPLNYGFRAVAADPPTRSTYVNASLTYEYGKRAYVAMAFAAIGNEYVVEVCARRPHVGTKHRLSNGPTQFSWPPCRPQLLASLPHHDHRAGARSVRRCSGAGALFASSHICCSVRPFT
jgi:hypothetical protein